MRSALAFLTIVGLALGGACSSSSGGGAKSDSAAGVGGGGAGGGGAGGGTGGGGGLILDAGSPDAEGDAAAAMCDPAKQDCTSGEKCVGKCLDSMTPGYACVADPGGMGGAGADCKSSADCKKGFQCISVDVDGGSSAYKCYQYCGADADCAGGKCVKASLSSSSCPASKLVLNVCSM